MIDLSQFVGKKVRVILKSGIVDEGVVKSNLNYDYPFSINLNYYSINGKWKNSDNHKYDILKIFEIEMNKYEKLEKQVAEMQKEIDRIKAEHKNRPGIPIETAKVGDVLEDGSIVVDKQGNMALLAAPQSTEVNCQWSKEFSEVFDALKSQGFNHSQWFVPTKEQLQLAYKTIPEHFSSTIYWSSTERNATFAYYVCFNDGFTNSYNKTSALCVRAFRCVTY